MTFAYATNNPDLYADKPWFCAAEMGDKPHDLLVATIESIRADSQTRISNTRRLICIYEYGYAAAGAETPHGDIALTDNVLAMNYARNAVNTVYSKVTKPRVLPMCLTSGGTYTARRIAKQRTKAFEAEFEKNDFEGCRSLATLDGLVTDHGAGFIKVFERGGECRYEQVPAEEIYVGVDEGKRKQPRSLFQVSPMDKYVVLDEFGRDDEGLYGSVDERRAGILKSGRSVNNDVKRADHFSIDVYEGWHLPSGPGAKDGRHTICTDSVTLVDEPWDWPCFPFAMYVPRPRLRSFWGLSFMRDLVSAQKALEHADARLQKSVKKMGGTHVIASNDVNLDEVDNDQGSIIRCPNGPADVQTWNPDLFNPQMMQWRESLVRWMPEHKGVSSLSTRSEIPAGLQQASGKALQVFEDFESEQLLPEHRATERLVTETAKLTAYVWRDIARRAKSDTDDEERKEYTLEYRRKGDLEKINVKDIAHDDGEEPLVVTFPVSQLARTPSAKFAQLMEMLNAGAITIEQFKQLFELPDLEAETEISTADITAIDWALDQMIYHGKPVVPDGFYKFELFKERARLMINHCRQYEVPESNLALVRDCIAQLDTLLQGPEPATSPAEGMAEAAMMPPEPPPMPPMDGPPMPPGPPIPPGMPPAQPPLAA